MEENESNQRTDDVNTTGSVRGVEPSEGSRESGAEDDEYETLYLVVQFPELEGTNLLEQTRNIKLSNVLGEKPVCELDGHVFTGEHDFSLGSNLVLNTEGSKEDFVVANTTRCINMQLSKING